MRVIILAAAMAATTLATPALAQALPNDPAALQQQFKRAVEQGPIQLKHEGADLPGAIATVVVTPTGRCTTRLDQSRSAFTYQGQSIPAEAISDTIDWSQVVAFAPVNASGLYQFAIVHERRKIVLLTRVPVQLGELATELQLACGRFGKAQAGLKLGAPPPWKQVRDAATREYMACRYERVPQLRIAYFGLSDPLATWKAEFERDPGEKVYSALSVTMGKNSDSSSTFIGQLDLDHPQDGQFTVPAATIAFTLDDRPLEVTYSIIRPGPGSYDKISLMVTRITPFLTSLTGGRRLAVTARDAAGTVLRRAEFDVASFRDVPEALNSTNWSCILS